jgi:hypothetical protein
LGHLGVARQEGLPRRRGEQDGLPRPAQRAVRRPASQVRQSGGRHDRAERQSGGPGERHGGPGSGCARVALAPV